MANGGDNLGEVLACGGRDELRLWLKFRKDFTFLHFSLHRTLSIFFFSNFLIFFYTEKKQCENKIFIDKYFGP